MDIQKQLDISKSLLESLQSLVNSFEKLTSVSQGQAQFTSNFEESLKKSKQFSSTITDLFPIFKNLIFFFNIFKAKS